MDKNENKKKRIILEALGLKKSFKRRMVVKGVDIEIMQGEIVGLLGPNGAGKTTIFHIIVGLTQPDEGKITLDEIDLTRYPMYERAKMGISYLPQEASIFRKLTVRENILAIMELLDLTKAQMKERADQVLDELKVRHVEKSKGYMLSGGERRRVEIARALVPSPSFMLLDEPFAGIDPIAVSDIQGIVNQLKNKGIGILITDHNVRETLKITDRAYIINEGEILMAGNPETIASSEKVRKFYLGDEFVL
ncbi:LPS export ABC transporter ATP-binding protein [bacterium]|nr:LPS export ABC transporter ATP-binding protein [bacterium]